MSCAGGAYEKTKELAYEPEAHRYVRRQMRGGLS
jgi:hypothetical protein